MKSKIILLATLFCGLNPAVSGAADSLAEMLEVSGVEGGLVVVVGCDDPSGLIDLGRRQAYLVHALDTDETKVEKARKVIASEKMTRRISVSTWDGMNLPFVDNVVNLLLLSDTRHTLQGVELERVLAPGGCAVSRHEAASDLMYARTGHWYIYPKPVPDSLDAWSHHMYDSTGIGAGNDRAVGPPRHLQWKAGPEFSRSHENMSSVSAVVSAGGRVFSIIDEGPLASIYLPSQWYLTARDAFSGVQLWKKPIESWQARLFPLKSGPAQLTRRIVATGNHVYATLGLDAPVSKLDAAIGKVLITYADPPHAEELLHVDGKLIIVSSNEANTEPFQGRMPADRSGFSLEERILGSPAEKTVTVFDAHSDQTLWNLKCGNLIALTAVADKKHLVFIAGTSVRCLDLNTGRAIWDKKFTDKTAKTTTYHSPTVLLHQGIVYVAIDGNLTAMDVKNGEPLWTAPCAKGGYRSPASIFILCGMIWDIDASGEPYRPNAKVLPGQANRTFVGYDLRTGEVRKEIPVYDEQGYGVMHHRCHVPRASGDYILTGFPGIEFIDTSSGDVKHHSWIRGACVYGFMPANGLIYAPPHPCACYMEGKLSGFLAVAPARSGSDHMPEGKAPKLVTGPAFGKTADASARDADDWPTYRGNATRSGRYAGTLPTTLKSAWKTQLVGRLTQPVISDGRLFTVARDYQELYALDADSGDILWSRNLPGKVDSAPTCHKGMVFFGSRDGHVYALRASDGERIWRFRAAPHDKRLVAYNLVESVWPVHGSVLVQDDVLWFVAGRSSFLDGGLFVYRLDPAAGKQLSMTKILDLAPDGTQPPILADVIQPTDIGLRAATRLDMVGAKPDVLSCDGERVFMRHSTFDLEGNTIAQDTDHLYSPTGFLDHSWFRRTYWIYGNHFVGGAQGWAWAGNTRPSGRIMSIGKDTICGFGRDKYPPSPGNPHQMYAAGEREVLFSMKKQDIVSGQPNKPSRRGPPRDESKTDREPNKWSFLANLQVRAMLLAGNDEVLFVAGAKGDWITSPDAYEGKLGSVLRAISARDGSQIGEFELSSSPVFDGMSAAYGKIYVALEDSSIQCWAE
jgi:outer membrane protein assembly factor BamB